MLHDIAPWVLRHEFHSCEELPESDTDIVLDICRAGVLARAGEARQISLPTLAAWKTLCTGVMPPLVFAFRFEDGPQRLTFRLVLRNWDDKTEAPVGWRRMSGIELRFSAPGHLAFAAITGSHIARWYASRKFCGTCGAKLVPDSKARKVACPVCGQSEHPAIAPSVIVAVRNGDSLLLTKYARSKVNNTVLVAGFVEIGETAEQAVAREVMEETGLAVHNIRYYGSQPWGLGSNIALGFVADVCGPTDIRFDTKELASAEWVRRSDIPDQHDLTSLTMQMIADFADGNI